MIFENEIKPYLNGEIFSNGLKIRISNPESNIVSRLDYVENICKGKKVIHLGCTDHIPLIKDKIERNIWLHKRLTNSASLCIGVDINSEAIKYVKEELGYNNILELNMSEDPVHDELMKENWDYLVMGEILEHLDNPHGFLLSLRTKYPNIKHVIITVPNALSYQNIKFSLKSYEMINSDHRFWFTPFTLAKLAILAGWDIDSFGYATYGNANFGLRHYFLVRRLRKYPHMRDSLIMVIKNQNM